VFFNKYVHKLVTTDNAFIDARFNYETKFSDGSWPNSCCNGRFQCM